MNFALSFVHRYGTSRALKKKDYLFVLEKRTKTIERVLASRKGSSRTYRVQERDINNIERDRSPGVQREFPAMTILMRPQLHREQGEPFTCTEWEIC